VHPFEYAAPATLDEAMALLSRHGAEAKVLAGGQSLVPLLNYRLARPGVVVDISGLPLGGIRADDDWLRLGALTRHYELEESPEITRRCPLLAEAARLIGNVRVRSLGTAGGSLAHADPTAELPMAMVALDARFTLASAAGRRTVDARDFFRGYLSTSLAHDELLTEIAVPIMRGTGWAIEEFARRPGDFALVAVAALVSLDRRGRVEDVRVAFAGVGDRPLRVPAVEDALHGAEPSGERLARVAEMAREALAPPSDAFASAAYRQLLASVLCRRALGRAVARARASEAGSTPPLPRLGEAAAKPTLEREIHRPSMVQRFLVNGRAREVDVLPNQTLLEVLRDRVGIFDVKEGCGEGVCGACTVLLDGRPVSTCLVLASAARGRAILTVRGLEREGGLHPLQEAFVRSGAVQCGFCTPGFLLTALAFLEHHPRPPREAIRTALDGNLCRCTGYTKIVDAVEAYARGDKGDG
jgi:xanthine dehydrogenase iron-sulfur cluster and FAD-binding subunit A